MLSLCFFTAIMEQTLEGEFVNQKVQNPTLRLDATFLLCELVCEK